MNDNRMNEPSEAQVEAAAKAIADNLFPNWTLFSRARASKDRGSLIHVAARAALVAAQGAAPQAAKDIHEPNHDRVYCVRCGGNWPCQPAQVLLSSTESPVEPFKTWFACWWKNEPNAIAESNAQSAFYAGWDALGLPSSGVDEEKLAEVSEAHVLGEPNGGTASWAWLNCSCGHRIEVAGVTREHVVALGRKHQARAVAEWLKGQGRGSEM